MYEYRGLHDMLFMMLYGGVAFSALLACLYLLFRQGNAFVIEETPTDEETPSCEKPVRLGLAVRSSRVLRRWTAALMAAIAASHVWWYVIGVYWLTDDRLVRNITAILLDHMTLVPLTMAVLLAMLQDRRRPLWPWLVAQAPVVVSAVLGITRRSMFYGYELPHYWQLAVIAVFVVYYIFALRRYGRWLLENYSDLDRKEVWQSMLFALVLLAVYVIYTSNAGELMREYLSQVISIVIIAFLLWRVETLQELQNEET